MPCFNSTLSVHQLPAGRLDIPSAASLTGCQCLANQGACGKTAAEDVYCLHSDPAAQSPLAVSFPGVRALEFDLMFRCKP